MEQDGDFGHDPERWPHTCDRLSRAVHLDISPDLTPEQVDHVAGALEDALAGL